MSKGCNKCGGKAPSIKLNTGTGEAFYSGPCRNEYWFLVGNKTPEEKVFIRSDHAEAMAYAIETNRSIRTIKAGALPLSVAEPLCPS